jgi:hypothetical protein
VAGDQPTTRIGIESKRRSNREGDLRSAVSAGSGDPRRAEDPSENGNGKPIPIGTASRCMLIAEDDTSLQLTYEPPGDGYL